MSPREFWQSSDEPTLNLVASDAGTTYGNLRLICLYGGACSPRLAKRLSEASQGAMTLEDILFREEQVSAE